MSAQRERSAAVRMECVPPDIFVLSLSGTIGDEEAREINAAIERFAEGKDGVFIQVDVTHLQTISSDARKAAVETSPSSRLAGIGVIGASLQARVFLTLIIRAVAIFRSFSAPFCFFSKESELRAWISEERQARMRRHLSDGPGK